LRGPSATPLWFFSQPNARTVVMTKVLWIGFVAIVLGLLTYDLGLTRRGRRVLNAGDALSWTGFYVFLALLFNVGVYFAYDATWTGAGLGDPSTPGPQAAIQFFTAWLLEKSLSLDNVLVIALVFSHFGIRKEDQHRVLFWGILGALVFRGALIPAGTELLGLFRWTSYVFGALLLFTAVRMLLVRHDNVRPERATLVRVARRWLPVADRLEGSRLFLVQDGRRVMTPLLQALLVIQGANILFAVDSVPAAVAVTQDSFLVFTSNIFAVLGLRALYFVLAVYLDRLRYLKMSLAFLLCYAGVKMMLINLYPIPDLLSVAIIAGILVVGVGASLASAEWDTVPLVSPLEQHIQELRPLSVQHARRVVGWVFASSTVLMALVVLVTPGRDLELTVTTVGVFVVELVWAARLLNRAWAESWDLHRQAERS
jgi:tellurite resistance protein TerC